MVSLDRGDITQNSFGFIVEEDDWTQDENGNTIRTINKVSRLLDCSVVTYPAYPDATIARRNYDSYKNKLEESINEKTDKELIQRNLIELETKLIKIKKLK
jgi:phage head maturation protease